MADTERRANDLRSQLATRTSGNSADGPTITVSAGCAAIAQGDDEHDFPALLAASDVALSQAKRSGRNRVVSAEVWALSPNGLIVGSGWLARTSSDNWAHSSSDRLCLAAPL